MEGITKPLLASLSAFFSGRIPLLGHSINPGGVPDGRARLGALDEWWDCTCGVVTAAERERERERVKGAVLS